MNTYSKSKTDWGNVDNGNPSLSLNCQVVILKLWDTLLIEVLLLILQITFSYRSVGVRNPCLRNSTLIRRLICKKERRGKKSQKCLYFGMTLANTKYQSTRIINFVLLLKKDYVSRNIRKVSTIP